MSASTEFSPQGQTKAMLMRAHPGAPITDLSSLGHRIEQRQEEKREK
ncbi:MAG: hypothetical protein WDM79_08650 [Terricaulis sp.]